MLSGQGGPTRNQGRLQMASFNVTIRKMTDFDLGTSCSCGLGENHCPWPATHMLEVVYREVTSQTRFCPYHLAKLHEETGRVMVEADEDFKAALARRPL
jgi:hypothetical protein